jgi:integrase
MSGSMRERRPGVWEIQFGAGRDLASGKYRVARRTVHGSKKAAKAALAELVDEVSKGRHGGSEATMGELLERWLALAEPDLSPTTAANYRRYVKRRILPAIGDVPVTKLQPDRLDALYASLRSELAPATVRMIHAIIHRALQQAVRWRWLPANPAALASPPPSRRHEISPPAPEAILRLVARAAEGDHAELVPFVRLSAATGARRGEVCALRWSDVDLEGRNVLIARAIIDTAAGPVEKDTKTHGKRRISLDHATVAVLVAHRARLESQGAALTSSSYVFSPELDGSRPWSPLHFTKAFKTLCRQTGIDGVRLHDLRHAHATQLLAANVPVRTVSGRLGHADAAVTLNVYGHWLEASDQDAADVIGGLLADPIQPVSPDSKEPAPPEG